MKEEKIPRAAKGRRFRLDCHTLPATTLRRVAAPASSGQTGLDASRKAQFSAKHMNKEVSDLRQHNSRRNLSPARERGKHGLEK